MMLTLTQRLPPNADRAATLTIALTAEERTRSRHHFETSEGHGLYFHLPRGTVLQDGDLLQSDDGSGLVRILAQPEPVLTVTTATPLALMRAAYHLGNRHIPLEITDTYLRLSPDPVLQAMLEHMGLTIHESILPFHPEGGAYGHSHAGH